MPKPKIFISYSHDSDEHCQQVLALSDRLNKNSIDCDIDQYLNGSPSEGWPLWMERMLEKATHVLVVCTEIYWKRVQGKEKPGKGKGVKWECLLTYQDIYDNDSLNSKFVPVIFQETDAAYIPKPLKSGSHYNLSEDESYEMLCRFLTEQPLVVKPVPEVNLNLPPKNTQKPARSKIYSDRLPTVKGEFFGRVAELQLLNNAWAGNDTRIIQFIAPGGTGKTKLLRHWLDHTDNIDVLIAWSFYSQGASEDKQISATPFFSHTFDKLSSTRTEFTTDEDKGDHLAELLRSQRTVLVLDGLEPLQHAGKGMRGELKDRAMRQLLKSLAGQNNGLCIITTRIAVHELSDRAHVISQDLQNLVPADGVKLLQSLGVRGSNKEMEKAVSEYGCHALALSLLGNVLRLRYDGDVLKRDTLKELVTQDGNKESRHAFKVMQTYQEWFANDSDQAPELALLYLLGLFDHPIEKSALQVLWDAQISNLTAGITAEGWQDAITALREEHHLLFRYEGKDDRGSAGNVIDSQLDCQPLIREYFGRQLLEKQPDVWRQAHKRLYGYYKALPEEEFPDTVLEMQPLFSAVGHGCAAGLHQQVMEEVYWPRIRRKGESYFVKKLGAFSDDLAVVAHFFTTPWRVPAEGLEEIWQVSVLSWASFDLRALGRLREALEQIQVSIEERVKQENWKYAAADANNLSELQLTLGDVVAAVASGQQGVGYADQLGDLFKRMSICTTHADALHQAGETVLALELFIEVEQIQREQQPEHSYLYSLLGYRYCDLLLAKGKIAEVLIRAEYALNFSRNPYKLGIIDMGLLDFALDQLTFGRAHCHQGDFPQATDWLDQAVAGLRKAGRLDYLPRGLLACAALYRDTRNPNHDFTRARQDLQEVYDISEPSGMRLHLTDYHLEMARLLIVEQENLSQSPVEQGESAALSVQEHVAQAAKLIEETGYKRRLPELVELQNKLATP